MSVALPFELAALRIAVNYQRWIADAVVPHLGARILEVGAGAGSMSRWLPVRDRLVLSECEPALLRLLATEARERFGTDPRVAVVEADISRDLPERIATETFDTVVSFNVLEHIEDDVAAFARLVELLRKSPGSQPRRIVTFVPAHQWAYGTIDAQYGHARRYSAAGFSRLARECCIDCDVRLRHFNLFGLPGWLLMGKALHRRTISIAAIRLFERLCPYIRRADDFLHATLRLPLGQSLLAVVTLR